MSGLVIILRFRRKERYYLGVWRHTMPSCTTLSAPFTVWPAPLEVELSPPPPFPPIPNPSLFLFRWWNWGQWVNNDAIHICSKLSCFPLYMALLSPVHCTVHCFSLYIALLPTVMCTVFPCVRMYSALFNPVQRPVIPCTVHCYPCKVHCSLLYSALLSTEQPAHCLFYPIFRVLISSVHCTVIHYKLNCYFLYSALLSTVLQVA